MNKSNVVMREAVELGRKDFFDVSIRSGADPDFIYEDGLTALHIAVEKGDVNMVRSLFARGCELSPLNADGETPLHIAARHTDSQHMQISKFLVDQGVDPNMSNAFGQTAIDIGLSAQLIKAVDDGREKVAMKYLSDGVQWNGDVPLWSKALEQGMDNLAYRYGSDEPANGEFFIHAAARLGKHELVGLLLHQASELDENKRTPLHYASDAEMAQLLISAGCDPNSVDAHGNTPLHVAKDKEVARVLVESGCDIHTVNLDGAVARNKSDGASQLWRDEIQMKIVARHFESARASNAAQAKPSDNSDVAEFLNEYMPVPEEAVQKEATPENWLDDDADLFADDPEPQSDRNQEETELERLVAKHVENREHIAALVDTLTLNYRYRSTEELEYLHERIAECEWENEMLLESIRQHQGESDSSVESEVEIHQRKARSR